ncbi:MAG: GTP-binding protein, partial [Clostridia bacterium]|nr:GTP-binding protein [Clostridia bacterium]
MKQYSGERIKNIALLGHGGAGKTTLADAILFYGKASDRIGKSADGTSLLDFDAEEKKRKVSVSTAVYAAEFGDQKLNLIDAPGQFDFAGGITEALAAADSAVIVVSGKSGLTVGAKQAFERARAQQKSVAFFIGKLDSTHAHFYQVLSLMTANFGSVICPIFVPYLEGEAVKCYVDLIDNKAYTFDGLTATEVALPASDEIGQMRSLMLEAVASV